MTRTVLYAAAAALTIVLVAFAVYRARSRSAPEAHGYSADVQYTDLKNPAKSYSGKMYIRWGKGICGVRTEYVYPDRQRIALKITGAGQTWMLDPEHRTYWAVKTRTMLKLRSIPAGGPKLVDVPEDGSFRSLGSKTIAGRKTQGFEITEPVQNPKLIWTAWEDDKLGTVLLIDKPGILRSEIMRVDETVPTENLFHVPAGYTLIDAPAS